MMNYVVCFEVEPTEAGRAAYLQLAANLRPELDSYPGFVSIERAVAIHNPNQILSLSYWQDEASIIAWRKQSQHREAQWLGRTELFRDYRLRIGRRLSNPQQAGFAITTQPIGRIYRSLSDPERLLAIAQPTDHLSKDALLFAVERDYGMHDRAQAPHPSNPIDAVIHPDPYPYYAELAAHRPFYWDESIRMWVASSLEAIRATFDNPDCGVRPLSRPAAPHLATFARQHDAPIHSALRQATIANIPSLVTPLTNDREEIGDFALRVPVYTLGSAFGVVDLEYLFELIDQLANSPDSAAGTIAQLETLISPQRIALLLQSYESTAALIGNTILAIGRENLPVGHATVRHVLRNDPPVQNTRRFAHRDTTIQGRSIRQGDPILLVLAAAGEPFGLGPHACPGEELAIQIALGGVQAWFATRWELRDHHPPTRCQYKASQNMRLPLRFSGHSFDVDSQHGPQGS